MVGEAQHEEGVVLKNGALEGGEPPVCGWFYERDPVALWPSGTYARPLRQKSCVIINKAV